MPPTYFLFYSSQLGTTTPILLNRKLRDRVAKQLNQVQVAKTELEF